METEEIKRRVLLLALNLGRRTMMLTFVLGLLLLAGLFIWLLKAVHLVASITAVATLLAYVLAPFVNYLTYKRKMNRILAISLVYLMVGLFILLGLTYVIPILHQQFMAMMQNLNYDLAHLQENLDVWHKALLDRAPSFLKPSLEELNPRNLKFENLSNELQNAVPAMLGSTFSGVFAGMKTFFGMLATGVLIPLFSFYILMDSARYREGFLRLFPRTWKKDVDELMTEIDLVLGSYIRGQLLVCLTIGVSIAIVLNILGLRYATLIGAFAGIVDIIPYVGVALGMIPAFIVALVYHGLGWAILVLVAMEVVHWSEGHIIVPAVIGHSVGLPPLVVMLALGAGAELGGIMGMFLSIPVAAILRVLIHFYVRKLEKLEAQAALEKSPPEVREDIAEPVTNGGQAEVPGTGDPASTSGPSESPSA